MTTKNTRKSTTKPKRKSRSLALGTGSAFRDWFLEQAGKPIMSESDYIKLRSETLPSLRFQLAQAEAQLAEMNRYRIAQQYALYAWTAKPNVGSQTQPD